MPYFTTAELRALPDLVGQEVRFPDARLTVAHDWIAAIVERECGTSFIPTTVTGEVHSGNGTNGLRLDNAYVQSVSAISIDGAAYTSAQVAAVLIDDGYLYLPNYTSWSKANRRNVTVTYVSGYSTTPPADLKQAMLRAARVWLLTSDAYSAKDSRSTGISNEFGNIQLVVASADGRPTGLPDVDAVITGWARRVRVPSVA